MFDPRKDLLDAELRSQADEVSVAVGHMVKLSKEAYDKALGEGYDKQQAMEIAQCVIKHLMHGK